MLGVRRQGQVYAQGRQHTAFRNRGLRSNMRQAIIHVALVVRDYDEAIDYYCKKLHFTLVEDSYQPEQDKRWVVVAPPGSNGPNLLLARASTREQSAFVGNQTGGRVFLCLGTCGILSS